MMVYNSQKGYGLKDLFGNLGRSVNSMIPVINPVLEGVKDIGVTLAQDIVGDFIKGKTPKASIKECGKQAKNMAAQCALQSSQGGRGNFSLSSLGWSDKSAKRKRSRSKSQPPAKRKRKQTGGVYPPIHYPLGNYPGYDNVMIGRGLFSKLRNRLRKYAIADCKDWHKRQQKGGRRAVKKRKPKKQTGSGKKRKPRKQTGKKRKPRKQTGAGKKRKSRKRTGKKSKSRKQTGDGLWSGLKEIFQ